MRPSIIALFAILMSGLTNSARADISPSTRAPAVRRFALVVGANDGGPKRDRLRYAASDAGAFARVLEELGGVSPADRFVVLEPKRSELDRAFGDVSRAIAAAKGSAARLELVLYYSGHSDEAGLLLGGARYAYGELQSALGKVPADVKIAVLDSCASAALFTRAKGGRPRPAFLVDESAKVRGHAFLSSSSIDEAALESDEVGGSFFTHYLLTGLRGAADASGDGRVTLNEAYQFAFHETLARTERIGAGAQHPAYDIQLAGTGDVVMTDLGALSSGIAFADDVAGRVFLRDAGGQLVAELRKLPGRGVSLHLPPGEYLVRLEPEPTREAPKPLALQVRVVLVEGKERTLALADLVPAERAGTQVAARGDHGATEAELEALGDEAHATIGAVRTATVATNGRTRSATVADSSGERARADGTSEARGARTTTDPGADGWVLASASVVPALSSNALFPVPIGTRLSFQLFYGEYARLDGFALGSGIDWATEDVHGLRIAGGADVVEGPLFGVDLAGVVALALGPVHGAQVAGAFTYAGGETEALQVGGGVAIARGELSGGQVAGAVAYAGGALRGLQVGGGVAVAAGRVDGLQIAGGLTSAAELRGLQVGTVNVSGPVRGAQLGVLNVASDVRGLQVGVVNVAEDVDVALGVFSFVKKGLFHVDLWGAESGLAVNGGLRFGSRYVYTQLAGGWDPSGSRLWTTSFGLGVHVPLKWIFALDVNAGAGPVLRGAHLDTVHEALLARSRVLLTAEPFEHFGVFVGPTLNLFVAFDEATPALSIVPSYAARRDELYFWPGLVAGIQL